MARMGRNILELDSTNEGVRLGVHSSPTYLVSIVRYLKDKNLLLFLSLCIFYL
jgi:hypothetical protein